MVTLFCSWFSLQYLWDDYPAFLLSLTHPLSVAGAAQIPVVVPDRVDEVDGIAVVLPSEGQDALRESDAETVRSHVVEALGLLLL